MIPIMDTSTQLIGARIRAARKIKKLSQTELGIQTNLDQGYISRLENGTAEGTPNQLNHIARTLGISILELIDEPHKLPDDDVKRELTAGEILDKKDIPPGLLELAEDENVASAISINNSEWYTLSTIELPTPISKDAYVQLLIAIRVAVATSSVTKT